MTDSDFNVNDKIRNHLLKQPQHIKIERNWYSVSNRPYCNLPHLEENTETYVRFHSYTAPRINFQSKLGKKNQPQGSHS